MITRAPRPESNFYCLDKKISEDRRLSWAARGLLIFLLGKPDNWQVSPAALTNETKGLKRGTGRDGVYAILKELKDVGYLRSAGTRDEAGSFAGTDYLVSETPDVVFHPHAPQPDTGQPRPANPPQVSTDKKQVLNKKQVLRESADAPAIPQSLLNDFLEVRKAKKAGPLTKTAIAGLQREADKAGISLEAAVTACCEFGWQTFNAGWYAERTAGRQAARQPAETFKERDARHAREAWERQTGRQWPADEVPGDAKPIRVDFDDFIEAQEVRRLS